MYVSVCKTFESSGMRLSALGGNRHQTVESAGTSEGGFRVSE